MASLTKKRDGSYIIRSYAGGFTTLQVSVDGVAFLKDHGIDENEEVPRPLIKQLLSMGLAFTTNATILGQPVPSEPKLTAPIENGLHMAIEENEEGWSLSILFPEIPLKWVRELYSGSNAATMQACGFRLSGTDHVILPAMRLWPGKGGAALLVAPETKPYTVEPVGPWPSSWDLHEWIQDIRGLEPRGTLFRGEEEGGVRLRAGNPITTGTSYYFVVDANTSSSLIKKPILPIPSQVQPRLLGRLEEWEAWAVHIPDEVDDITREWCNQIGHPLEKPLWRLQFVTPPPLRYTSNGLPIFEVGVEAIIAVFPPPQLLDAATPTELIIECNNSQVSYLPIYTKSNLFEKSHPYEENIRQGLPIYFALPLHLVGTYRLRAITGRVAPLTFTTSPADFGVEQITITEQPPPLKVYVTSNSSKVCMRAFDASHPKIDLPYISEENIPTIEVDCPSPIDVYWSCGEFYGKQLALPPGEITTYLSKHLVLTTTNKHMFVLHIDAGNIGSLRLHFLPLAAPSSDIPIESSSLVTADVAMISQRVRWLSVAIPALSQQGASIVSIPGFIQKSLAQIKGWPDGIPLAQLTQVPLTLLPHLIVLARSLDARKHNFMNVSKNRTTDQKQQTFHAAQANRSQIRMQSKEMPHE